MTGMPKPVRYYGVVEGIVEDIDDPKKEGRIKVSFPWFGVRMVSNWSRVLQLHAGPKFGSYFVPERKSEVLVAFIHGEMRRPIVLGGAYNGKDKPVRAREKDQSDPKYIQTQAGHRIVFEDQAGKQKIEVVDASGKNSIVIDTAANTITVKSQGDVSIEATTGSLTLKGKTGVTISSDATVTVKGQTINLN